MNFKDIIADDVDKVFFNEKEFAESVIIDGKTVPIITDDDALSERTDVTAMALSDGERLIFIKVKDMVRLPQIGDKLIMDTKEWFIRHVAVNVGVYELRIGRDSVAHYV